MKRLDALGGAARRRHERLLRRWRARWGQMLGVWVRRPCEFRMVQRLHRAGIVVAVATKSGILTGRPFRELQIFQTHEEAVDSRCPIMPGARKP